MARYITLVTGKQTLAATVQASTGVPDADKVVSLDATGKLDPSLFPSSIGEDIESIITSEALAAGDFVNIYDNAGTRTVRKANAGATQRVAHGFVLAGFANAAIATVYLTSVNTQVSGLLPGATVYLATVAGGFTTTPPAITSGNIIQFIGYAASATSIEFEFDQPIYIP